MIPNPLLWYIYRQHNEEVSIVTDKTERTSGLAISGFIIAILAILGSWVPIINNVSFFFAIIALIFGIIGLKQIKKGKRVGQGLATATIIIAILAGVVVLASQAFYGKAVDEVSQSINEAVSDSDGTNTDKLLENTVDVTLGQFVFDAGAEAEYSYDDTTKLPITIKNKSSDKASFSVKIEAVDASGNRIADDTVYVSDLNAGQSQTEDAFKYVESDKLEAIKTASFKILSVSK